MNSSAGTCRSPWDLRDDEVLVAVREVGVCGTDRELAEFRIPAPPEGESFLVIGHEELGQVVDAGPSADAFRPGDWVAPMIRRSCPGPCDARRDGRRHLCLTGRYRERGIAGQHGYFAELSVDSAEDLVPIPSALVESAVLLEPLSVVEKAVDLGLGAHPGYFASDPPSALVLGTGTVGLLAGAVLSLRGYRVTVVSKEPTGHPRARLAERADLRYATGAGALRVDVAIEATGAAEAAVTGLRALAPLGVLVVLGARNGRVEFPFLDLILGNHKVIGPVNSSPQSFQKAVEDLARIDRSFLKSMIPRVAFDDFRETILSAAPTEAPKFVHTIGE